jgi:hypothetical protein
MTNLPHFCCDFLEFLKASFSWNHRRFSRPVKWSVYLIDGYRTPVFHTTSTQVLLTRLSPFGLCIDSRAARAMFNNSLVPSVECRMPAAFHMQCRARRHDPRMVLMKAQWWFVVPFTYKHIHRMNCTVPSFFLSSQFRHNTLVFFSWKWKSQKF